MLGDGASGPIKGRNQGFNHVIINTNTNEMGICLRVWRHTHTEGA